MGGSRRNSVNVTLASLHADLLNWKNLSSKWRENAARLVGFKIVVERKKYVLIILVELVLLIVLFKCRADQQQYGLGQQDRQNVQLYWAKRFKQKRI